MVKRDSAEMIAASRCAAFDHIDIGHALILQRRNSPSHEYW